MRGIDRRIIDQTEDERSYERYVLNIWQRLKLAVWRWRAERAFDERDRHMTYSPTWRQANDKVERLFK